LGWGGMTWMWIVLAVFFASGGAMSILKGPRRGRATTPVFLDRSIFGVDGFKTTEGGVTFEDVEPPGAPADKAGLVGGDIITSFDGQVVHDEDQIRDLLGETPVGKIVDVVFIRDGETKSTKMTKDSKEEVHRLDRDFRVRAEGRG